MERKIAYVPAINFHGCQVIFRMAFRGGHVGGPYISPNACLESLGGNSIDNILCPSFGPSLCPLCFFEKDT